MAEKSLIWLLNNNHSINNPYLLIMPIAHYNCLQPKDNSNIDDNK